MIDPVTINLQTNYPITMLFLLGREWHAEYCTNRVCEKYLSREQIKQDAQRAVKQALSYDY